MSQKELTIIWIVAALLSASLLFPPFGYTKYMVIPMAGSDMQDSQQEEVPWTYLHHQFLFQRHGGEDKLLSENFESSKEMVILENVKIAWGFVVVECAVILLIGTAAFLTVRRGR